MSISPRSGAWALWRLPSLKYNNVPKRESRFTLGLDAAKNTRYIKKMLQIKLLNIKFRLKKSAGACVYLPQEWS